MIYDMILEGFTKMDNFKKHYEQVIGHLLELAPSDACASSSLKKIKKGYEGVLNIISSQGHFVAKAVSQDPLEVAQSLLKQVKSQIVEWQGTRFLPEEKAY